MRIATGLLLAMWLLFIGYKFLTTQPVGYDGELLHFIGGFLIFIQLIAWAFVFTKPIVTFIILLLLTVLSIWIAVSMESAYTLFAVVNTIFAVMSYAGHREIVKMAKTKIAAKIK
ncbi:hypothetical protein E5161_10070 [Cohnella pontilimi]|uniref:Uncharacterized protein n=1 Tax=Cohnella pontilimi TaxID=2564100 RepID=A0A4U0FBU9_9BACL|nr:hypothetical protein [Cohnella pontilimi]TJY42333.1 hypothetical protein E5161_10070 [Cohnella pontilimi]